MKSVSVRKASSVVMCRRCRNETLPRLKLPSWQRDVLRSAADGMVAETDPKAERIKRRKGAREIRNALAQRDYGTIKLLLTGLQPPAADVPTEECPDCLAIIEARLTAGLSFTEMPRSA